jgi:hypothetical protein
MKNLFVLPLMALTVFALSGCVSREFADKKLVNACSAAVAAFLPEGRSIAGTNGEFITNDEKLGAGYRTTLIKYKISDGFAEEEKEYSCIFMENFGPFQMSYTASIYQLKMDDKIVGQDGYSIVGSAEDMAKLSDAVAKVLNN